MPTIPFTLRRSKREGVFVALRSTSQGFISSGASPRMNEPTDCCRDRIDRWPGTSARFIDGLEPPADLRHVLRG